MNEPVGVLGRLSYSDINKNDIVEANEILSEADYYPFGLQHTENSIATTANKAAEKYQYNAKEFQDELNLNLNVFDYGVRNYDAAIGRWFNVDPLAEKMPNYNPYVYTLNNPIVFTDPDGQYPIYFMTRSYAPFKTFGPNNSWHGDSRGHSIDRYASYRGRAIITHNTELKTTYADGGRSRSYTMDGKKDDYSNTITHNRSKGANIDVHSVAGNEAQPGAKPIDQFTKLSANIEGNIKQDHILSIKGTISGDDFPNQESLIYDAKGNTLWLGNFETSGDRESGPVWNLFFENENDVHINVNVRIKVNKEGVFQGVMQKGKDGKEKVIPIKEWNKKFE